MPPRCSRSGQRVIAAAQSPADFYKNRNVDEYIGYSTGGAYDFYARVIGRHMGAHIPGNPTLIPRNMEGAGSLRLANWLYRVAPQDGSAFGTFGRGIAFDPLLIGKGDQFDAQKFNWLGSANNEVSVCVALKDSGITKFEDLFTKELTVGGTGTSADTDQFPRVLNNVLGTHFKIVEGYPGGNDVVMAMERGEVNGRCGWSWSSVKSTHKSWIDEKKMIVLVQLSLNKHPELPDVPLGPRFRQDRRAARDPQDDLRPPGDGPALCGAAQPAGRQSRRVAPGLHGDDDRTRIFSPKPTRPSSRSIRSPARTSRNW